MTDYDPYNLVTERNQEVLKKTALRIGFTVEAARKAVKRGQLAAQRTASGRWYSSKAAAQAFMNGGKPAAVKFGDDFWVREMQKQLRPTG